MISSYPLGVVNYFIRNPTWRLWYGLITGFVLQYLMYQNDCFHLVAATFLTYLFLVFLGRKISAFWVLGMTVLHLSGLHIHRMIVDWGGWHLDSTTIYMMSICKFSSIAFSYEDGAKADAEFKSSYHKSKKVVERPTLLETFSYMFYYSSSLMGPSFEFRDFREFINLEASFKNIPMRSAIYAGLIELLKSFLNILSVVFLLSKYNYTYCLSKEFEERSLLFKFFYFNLAMSLQRTKYYAAWKMCQASVVICGLGYNSETPGDPSSDKFDRVVNCTIREVELSANPKKRIQYWNRTVHLWLKYNLFLRLLNVEHKYLKNNTAMASLITFMVSAFWHGFYPIYYVFFFQFYIVEQICEFLEKDYDFFRYMEGQHFLVNQAFSFITQCFCNYLGIIFSAIDIENGYKFTKSMYFLPPILIVLIFLVLRNLHIKKVKRDKKQKEAIVTPGIQQTNKIN